MFIDDADSRLTGGLADGETRVFHGLTDEPIPEDQLKGTNAIVRIKTFVHQSVVDRVVAVPFILAKTKSMPHLMERTKGVEFMRTRTAVL